jgi:hypothetical protein
VGVGTRRHDSREGGEEQGAFVNNYAVKGPRGPRTREGEMMSSPLMRERQNGLFQFVRGLTQFGQPH